MDRLAVQSRRSWLGPAWLTTMVLVASLLVGCGAIARPSSSPVSPQSSPSPLSPDMLTLVIQRGDQLAQLKVEVADDASSRSLGLSGRQRLPADQGMLFVFEQDSVHRFWMKDTYVPLSIAFITVEGQIVDVQDMQPLTEDLHYPSVAYRFGLEANQAYFDQHGLGVGSRVTILDSNLDEQPLSSLLP